MDFFGSKKVQRQLSRELKLNGLPKFIITDFDGCLTDDRVFVNEHSEEFVAANRKDGLAVTLLRLLDVETVIISREQNNAVKARAAKLKVVCFHGVNNKLQTICDFLTETENRDCNYWYVGNDLNDMAPILQSPFSLAPADAVSQVKKSVDVVLHTNGGEGVLAEIARQLLTFKSHPALVGEF